MEGFGCSLRLCLSDRRTDGPHCGHYRRRDSEKVVRLGARGVLRCGFLWSSLFLYPWLNCGCFFLACQYSQAVLLFLRRRPQLASFISELFRRRKALRPLFGENSPRREFPSLWSVRRPIQAKAETEFFKDCFEKLSRQTPAHFSRRKFVSLGAVFRSPLQEATEWRYFGIRSRKSLDLVPNDGISIACLEDSGGFYAEYLQTS